ncbi:MAG: carboxymuconolactone decarboxylase family protein [Gammaproteobacteria bacterium]
MARIPYPDPEALSPTQRAMVQRSPLNVGRMMGHLSEPVHAGFSKMGMALLGGGSNLPPLLRELAILRVGHLSRSRYEVHQHEGLCRNLGFAQDKIAGTARGADAGCYDAVERAVLAFTDDVVANVRAGDATLAEVRRHLTDNQVADLMVAIGTYMMVSRLLETFGVDMDPEGVIVDPGAR